MSLTLAIRNVDRLDNGAPTELVLNRRGATIGRSPTCDWSLPDARNYISSRHCDVSYRDGFYFIADVSTNGTFLNGGGERMKEMRRVVEGDCFLIGHYQVTAHLSGDAAAALEREQQQVDEAQKAGAWNGWDAHGGSSRLSAAETGWTSSDRSGAGDFGSHAAPLAPGAGWGTAPVSAGWDAPAPAPAVSGWGQPPSESRDDGWSEPPADAISSSGAWAPRLGTPLAPEPDHLAQGRRAAGGGAAPAAPGMSPAAGSSGWAAPAPPAAAPTGPSTWDQPGQQVQGASGWSSVAPDRPPPPSTDDVWGQLAAGNVVDWANSGFGQPLEENRDPLGLAPPAAPSSPAPAAPIAGWGAPPASQAPPPSSPPPAAPTATAVSGGEWGAADALAKRPARDATPTAQTSPAPAREDVAQVATRLVEAFAAAAGLKAGQLKNPSPATIDRAGQLMRRLVGGLVVMMEARARAKSQMGAEATSLSLDGNSPIKFARTPEQAVAQLLNPVERGFMDADKAIDDAFFDLQSHQMATLKAMQGALRATLDRFSPNAIRSRAEQRGLFARILPGAREAALWQAYEREFSGVARGSDEAFMDVFAKEFRKAYEDQSRQRKS